MPYMRHPASPDGDLSFEFDTNSDLVRYLCRLSSASRELLRPGLHLRGLNAGRTDCAAATNKEDRATQCQKRSSLHYAKNHTTAGSADNYSCIS